ncbi:hypothetical protein ACHAWT_001142 [Skeletonema menzelii]|mmetsp:Transcript_15104/g.24661  ORF Transcript_15104/g.24661 Transcript_15104/m.24661 type:complete len:506 (+) Transcript_15104:123-1640(+)
MSSTFVAQASAAIALFSTQTIAFAPSHTSLLSRQHEIISQAPSSSSALNMESCGFGKIDIDENAPRSLPPFEAWCAENGVQKMDGVELYSEDGVDYQAVTTVDIPAGSTVMYIPAQLCLHSSTVGEELCAMSPTVQQAADQLQKIGSGNSIPDFYLFLKLLIEYEKEDQSDYFPFLDSLPRLYFNAASMTDFCYECLPPLVFSLSRMERVKLENFQNVLQKVDLVSAFNKQNLPLLKWCFNAVYTRAYADKEGQGSDVTLTPMADMFNHGTDTEVEVYFDEGGNAMAYTTVDVPANSPLRISYGCPTNPSFLFARYGFMDDSSPATFCKMMDIPKTPENVNMGMDFSKMLFYHDTGDISQEVMDVVLYAKVLANIKYSPETGDVKQQFYDAHMNGDEATKAAIHEAYRYETIMAIKKHVDTFMDQLIALEEKSAGKSFEEHPRLPVILHHNQFVKETFSKVQQNLDNAVAEMGGPANGDGGWGGDEWNGGEWPAEEYNQEYAYME